MNQNESRKVILRSPLPGEWGWIMATNGSFYAYHYGYNSLMEQLCGEAVCEFLRYKDSTRCKTWIADVGGKPMGCIMCTASPVDDPNADVAKLRFLHVAPEARGLGIGTTLVAECVRFAKEAGYKKMTLYTHAHLAAALKVYGSAGFRLAKPWVKSLDYGPELEDGFMELNLE